MAPFLAIALNLSMFTVAQPAIRIAFGMRADTTSWIMTAYLLPYLILMPLYGQWGDFLGKRTMLIAGLSLYGFGTVCILLAPSLAFLFLGRVLQGIGSASVNPMCLAIIMSVFPSDRRGKALASWNSMGPMMGMVGPILGGFLIDRFSWRAILLPLIGISLITVPILVTTLPKEPKRRGIRRMLLRFDWIGAFLLTVTITFGVFYLSSEIITARPPLTDFRLLAVSLAALGLFLVRERRYHTPFVPSNLFAHRGYTAAAIGVSVRMVLLGSMNFLLPLFLTDLYALPAALTGIFLTVSAAALLVAMKFGGFLADRWSRRFPAIIGLGLQTVAFTYLAILPRDVPVWSIGFGGALNGLAAGLSLVSLHRSALDEIPTSDVGTAAGIYSMIRFIGSLVGAALNGVVLQSGLERLATMIGAYRRNFWVAALIGFGGMLVVLFVGRTPHPGVGHKDTVDGPVDSVGK